MKKSNFFAGLLITIIGLLLLIIPKQCVRAVVILLGLEAITNGIFSLMYTRKLVPDSSFQFTVIMRGMLSLVIGLLAFFLPLKFMKAVSAIWTIMLYILAVYLLFSAGLELFAMGKIRNTEIDRKSYILEALISIIAAVIMFLVPQTIGEVILRIAGLFVAVCGGLYLLYTWKNRPIVQEPVEVVDDISGEIEKS
ncbi:MAG: DUF308 domain-containing protein [Treponema sp.]|nr:DUF308 domain-containing protein [Treponema sp.]